MDSDRYDESGGSESREGTCVVVLDRSKRIRKDQISDRCGCAHGLARGDEGQRATTIQLPKASGNGQRSKATRSLGRA